LNSDPGCWFSTGLLFQLGPFLIGKYTTSYTTSTPFTILNPFIHAEKADVLSLNQLVNVGFSYSSDGSAISNTLAAAKDVWSFLELFLTRFPEYARTDFYLAAESYGGHYAPNIASAIYRKTTNIKEIGNIEGFKGVNVKSVIFTNGITEPYTHLGTVPDFLCTDRTQYLVAMDPSAPSCAQRSRPANISSRQPARGRGFVVFWDWETDEIVRRFDVEATKVSYVSVPRHLRADGSRRFTGMVMAPFLLLSQRNRSVSLGLTVGHTMLCSPLVWRLVVEASKLHLEVRLWTLIEVVHRSSCYSAKTTRWAAPIPTLSAD
jgi:hypothetical protein